MLRLPEFTAVRILQPEKTILFLFLLLALQSQNVVCQWLSYEDVSKRLTDRCESGEYDCLLGDKCISITKYKDGVVDCLDGSDEFCYPGQVKCGSICVELQFLGECLANPTCENTTKLPIYCNLIKPKLCRFEDAVPCKGYGECVLRKWLDDGNKDCFDGSDEDPDYVRLLTSCLYPLKEKLPDGFIESSNQVPDDRFQGGFPGTLPDQFYPGFDNRPDSGTKPQQPPETNDHRNTKFPWNPWDKNGPLINPPSINEELVPINPFVRISSTPKPSEKNGPIGYGGNYGDIVYPPPSGGHPDQGPLEPDFGNNGVAEGGGSYGFPMTPIIPVNEFTHPPYPFDKTDQNKEKNKEKPTKQPVPVDKSPWIDITDENSGKMEGDEESKVHQGRTQQPTIPTGVVPSDSSIHFSSTTSDKISTETGRKGPGVETWSPFSGERIPSSNTETHDGTAIGGQSGQNIKESEYSSEGKKTSDQNIKESEYSSGGRKTSDELPFIPFIPFPAGIPTGFLKTTTSVSRPFSPKFSKTTTTRVFSTTHLPEVTSTFPTTSSSKNKIESVVEPVVSDPYKFRLGLDEKLTTSAPGNLNCSERIRKAATELVPYPFCDCPSGYMRNITGTCVRSEISTFQARLRQICGETLTDLPEESRIITWKLSTTLNYPVCVRKADDVIIFNTVCSKCEFTDLIGQYAMSSDLPEIDVKLSELQDSGCYDFELNDCNEKADCHPDGLRYWCKCLPGTTDSGDGSGRNCDGIVIANQCAKFLGVCVLFWVLLLLLLAILLPIIAYFLYKYCKKRNVKVFDRFQKKKKRVEISSTVQTSNLEAGIITSENPEYSGPGQWDRTNIPTGRASIPTITTTFPKSTPLNQLLPKDEYCIIENDDDEDAGSLKGDAASIGASSDSTTVMNKNVTTSLAQSDAEPARRPSADSRSATPTIWETYKILGQQYTRFSSGKRRKSSTHSLEILLKRKQEEEFKKRATALSLSDVEADLHAGLPPLPTVSLPHGTRKPLGRADSKKSITSAKSDQSNKLSDMLGVSRTSIPEETVEAIAESTEADAVNAVQKQIPFHVGSIPSTPEIQKAAETAVTDALRNVIGPQYDPKSGELQVSERLQTTTKISPSGSREDLPVVGQETVGTSARGMKQRPGSGASNRSRTTLPSPTIEPGTEEGAANLDAVAEALAQLPPIPVPSLPRLDGKRTSSTSPSTARKKKKSTSPKTARSLTSEKSIKFTLESPKSARKTIASTLKEKPPVNKYKFQTPRSEKSELDLQQPQFSPTRAEPKTSPKTARKPPLPRIPSGRLKPITAPTNAKPSSKPSPVYRQPSAASLKPKRVSSIPPSRKLPNISERSEQIQMQQDTSSVNNLPISLPSTAQESSKMVLKRIDSKNSKLPQLVDPKKASSVFCQCDEPQYIVADLDLDLPGPYMVPASSIEDLKRVGVSRLPRITTASQSAPSSERLPKQILPRQSSTKSEDLWKSNKLPPIDVDLEDNLTSDFDIDTSRLEKTEKHATSTIARKIATRKAAGHDYPKKQKKPISSSNQELQYEYRRSTSRMSHVHDGCLKDQPPWDPTPLRNGEIEQIPLDWNISRSNSQMSLNDRRTQSQGDVRQITSVKIYNTSSPKHLNEENKSSSLTNIFHFQARIPDMDTDWVNSLKTSLKKTNNWLDYD